MAICWGGLLGKTTSKILCKLTFHNSVQVGRNRDGPQAVRCMNYLQGKKHKQRWLRKNLKWCRGELSKICNFMSKPITWIPTETLEENTQSPSHLMRHSWAHPHNLCSQFRWLTAHDGKKQKIFPALKPSHVDTEQELDVLALKLLVLKRRKTELEGAAFGKDEAQSCHKPRICSVLLLFSTYNKQSKR